MPKINSSNSQARFRASEQIRSSEPIGDALGIAPETESGRSVRVVVVSERSIMAEGMRSALSAPSIEVAAVCLDWMTAAECVSNIAPDVLVADVGAAELTADFAQRLRRLGSRTRTVVVLDRTNNSELFRAARLGSFGVVSVKASAETLRACVNAVASGIIWIQSEFAQGASRVTAPVAAPGAGDFDSLTAQQRKIAEMVAAGMRNKHIAAELGITEGTVKVHLHSIFARLGISSRVELGNAFKFPWVLNPTQDDA